MQTIYDNHLIDTTSLGENPIFVDTGACFGACIDWALSNLNQPKVYAIEPCKTHISTLENKFNNIQIYWAALVGNDFCGDSVQFNEFIGLPKWGQIAALDKSRAKSAATYKKLKGIENYKVPVIRIGELFNRLEIKKIDYLKMDIEGTEEEVIRDIDTVAPFISQMSIEIHSDSKIKEKLVKLGYKVTVIKNEVHAIR